MKKFLAVFAVAVALVFSACTNDAPAPKVQQKNVEKIKMADFRAVPESKAQILQKGEGKMFCPVCGMTLPKFYKTNHAAKHNGNHKQYCSIQCMAEDKEVNGKKLTELKAVDNESLTFKNSKDMFFVVGSKKPGTMSVVSKYGFATKDEANKFAAKFGGKVMTFEQTYALVKDRLQDDIAATKKRQAKAAKMGEKIYSKMCNKTQMRFSNPSDAKTYLVKNKVCGDLKGKKLQQVALYLSGKNQGMKNMKSMKCGAGKCGGKQSCGMSKCGAGKCGK